MKQFIPFLILSGLLSMAGTCGKAPAALSASAYVEWVEHPDNGLFVSKTIGTLKFELQYTPPAYCVLRENPGISLSGEELQTQASDIGDMQYFTFRISDVEGGELLRKGMTVMSDFSTRLAYFSSKMQNDLRLVEGTDTLRCLLYHYERAYGVDPRSTFVLGFPLGKTDASGGAPATLDKTFFFDDHELGTGPVMLVIKAGNLSFFPSINPE